MNKDEILAMKPDRELDALVSKMVFNIKTEYCHWFEGSTRHYDYMNDNHEIIPHYSTDISAAWEVFEWLIAKHSDATLTFPWCIAANFDGGDWCRWKVRAEGESAPEVICKAALIAGLAVNSDE